MLEADDGGLVARAPVPRARAATPATETEWAVEDRYRLLVDLMPDGVVVHQDGRVVYVNASCERLVGLPTEQTLGRPITDFIHPESLGPMLERIAGLVVPGVPSEPTRVRMLRADGRTTTVESVSVMTTWQGRPAMQAILRDLTEHLAVESALTFQAALVEHVNDAIIAVDGRGLVRSWNPAAASIFGIPAADAIGRPMGDLVGADLAPARVLGRGRVEVTVRSRHGADLTIRASAAPLGDGSVLVCSNDTAQREAELRLSDVFESLEAGLLIIDEHMVIQAANPAAAHLLEVDAAELSERPFSGLPLHREDGRPVDSVVAQAFRAGQPDDPGTHLLWLTRSDDSRVWLSASVRKLASSSAQRTAVISMNDITERRTAVEKLEHAATRDALTGLPNRALALTRLRDLVDTAAATNALVSVLFVDLDNFKLMNDAGGHDVGDQALQTVAERIKRCLRRGDLASRIGGDEFVVAALVTAPDEGEGLARRVLEVLAEPLTGRLRGLPVRASIGVVTTAPGDRRSPADLIRDADAAMYRAKARGRNRTEVFDDGLRAAVLRRVRLETDLRDALDQGSLWLAYQPIVDLKSGRWSRSEALIRWNHPELGLVNPLEFIPIAEESDLINVIGAFVLDTACRDVHDLRRRGEPDLTVSVNLSARQLDDPGLVALVGRALERHRLPPSALCLEITESTLADDEIGSTETLDALKSLGVSLSIDDFGTGYSSLARLLTLPVDELKIDRSFVTDMPSNPTRVTVVSGILTLAHALGMHVVAEGVETSEHVSLLTGLGCDFAQGYHFAKPKPLLEFATPDPDRDDRGRRGPAARRSGP